MLLTAMWFLAAAALLFQVFAVAGMLEPLMHESEEAEEDSHAGVWAIE